MAGATNGNYDNGRLIELTVEGHRMAALAFNEDKPGTPAVFIHGIASSPYFWSLGQTPVFRQRFRWYALTLPGHYPAAFAPDFRRADLTAENLARIAAAAVRQLTGGEPALLAGHSTGGFLALATAAHAPELARAVFSAAGFVQGRWNGALGMLQQVVRLGPVGQALFALDLKLFRSTLALYRLSVGLYTADRAAFYAAPNTETTFENTLPAFQRLDLNAVGHYFARMPHIDIRGWLPRITAPVLALTGAADPIVPPEQSRLIAAGVPDGTLMELPGAGHMLMAERPEGYAQAVTDWVNSLGLP